MKNVKKKDIILVAVIALAAVILLFAGLNASRAPQVVKPVQDAGQIEVIETSATPSPEPVSAPAEASDAVKAAVAAYFEQYPAQSYLLITTAAGNYTPVPLNGDAAFKIHFGEDEYNLVHIGENSVYMEESTCENQNCVGQGEITLDNIETRVLMNMILCLPHELTLELVDAEVCAEYLTEYYTAVEAYAQMAGGSEDAG